MARIKPFCSDDEEGRGDLTERNAYVRTYCCVVCCVTFSGLFLPPSVGREITRLSELLLSFLLLLLLLRPFSDILLFQKVDEYFSCLLTLILKTLNKRRAEVSRVRFYPCFIYFSEHAFEMLIRISAKHKSRPTDGDDREMDAGSTTMILPQTLSLSSSLGSGQCCWHWQLADAPSKEGTHWEWEGQLRPSQGSAMTAEKQTKKKNM